MSSLASLFNSSAALFVGDFYTKIDRQASQERLVVVGRIATATVVVLGIVWIPIMQRMSNVLYEYLQAVQGLLAPAIAAAFVLGVFWRRTTAAGGFWGLAAGFAMGMFRLGLNIYYSGALGKLKNLTAEQYHPLRAQMVEEQGFLFWVASVNWLHYTIFLFVASVAITVVLSLLGKAPTPEQLRYTYGAATPEEKAATRASWNGWDVLNTLIAIAVIVAFYAYFW
jgi:SSS family solute:Na+ symporter